MINYRITQDNIMELLVSGKVTKDDIDATWIKVKADMQPAHGKVRLLEIISDLQGVEPAPSASALLHHMDTPGLELSVMFLRVSGEVRKATRNKQTPEVTDGRDGTEFYFVSTASKRAGISAAPVSVNQSAPQPAPLEKDLVRPSDRYQVVRDTVVLDRPGIGQTSVGRLQVGDIVVNLPYKSARWRAIQMASGRQGFVESATTRPLD